MKTKTASHNDGFLLLVAGAVVILSAFFVLTRMVKNEAEARVEGANTETVGEMLKQVEQTRDDSGTADFLQLDREIKGL